MVQLQTDRECPRWHPRHRVQSLDDGHLPRRAAQVELPCVDPGDLDAQLTPVTRLRQRDVADVVFEIEIGIVHPVRHVQTAGQIGQPSPECRRKMQAGCDLFEDSLEGDPAAGRGRRVIDQQHLDLYRGLRPFGSQHHVVCPAELLHVKLRPRRSWLPSG